MIHKDYLRNQLAKLNAEEHQYHDMLFPTDLVDSYHNLMRKSMGSILWIAENMNVFYVFKTEDDVYILVRTFLEELEARKSAIALYWSHFHYNSPIRSNVKNYDTKHDWFLCKIFLPHASQ